MPASPASAPLDVTPYERRHRSAVRELLTRNYYTHIHLDWIESEHWLESERAPARLAWQQNRLVGLLAASIPLGQSAWIRLAAIQNFHEVGPILAALWQHLVLELRARGVEQVAWLILRDWVLPHISALGFTYGEEVITLRRAGPPPLHVNLNEYLAIRRIREDDLPALADVDQHAFRPPWQMSYNEIRQAERSCTLGTAAVTHDAYGERIIGYQMSLMYFDSAHLARLAVLPSYQKRGVGSALVGDAIHYFAKRGMYAMTVNTQRSNEISQRVYQRWGFERNGFDLPVYVLPLPPA